MSRELPALEMKEGEWRAWLAKNHSSSPGVWLVFRKARPGPTALRYEATVRDALCFGWIDSLIKRLDGERYARKFTPRTPGSKWSDLNRRRWAELKRAGLLEPAGLAAAPTSNAYPPRPVVAKLPGYIARAFRKDARAWAHFQKLAPTYRRQFVLWIDSARRPETRARRIREATAILAAGGKLGLR